MYPIIVVPIEASAGRDTGGEAAAARPGTTTQAGSGETNQVTLSATIQESALLVFAQDRGRLSLVLRNPDDIAVVDGLPETSMNDIIQSRGRVHAVTAQPAQQPRQIEVIRGGGN